MSQEIESERIVRKKCTVLGENCYALVGKKSLMIKLPYENRKEMEKLREAVEAISAAVTEGLEYLYDKEANGNINTQTDQH